MDIVTIFCDIDDFCLIFELHSHRRLLTDGTRQRNKPGSLSLAEVMTILVWFHSSGYRDFKTFYTQHVVKYLLGAFPGLVSLQDNIIYEAAHKTLTYISCERRVTSYLV